MAPISHALTVPPKEAPANSVPAAAVIRRARALIGITGRKSARRLLCKLGVKSHGSTVEQPLILRDLNPGEGGGIPGVGVKSVDIWRNISGEGGHLDRY